MEVDFVGPWQSVKGPTPRDKTLPQPPLLPGETARETAGQNGTYHEGVAHNFTSTGHAAKWGRQTAQSKDTIQAWVAEYQPEYLLVLLGFNDLGWFVSGPEGLIADMSELIGNARKAKSDIKIVLGNVVDRSFISGRQDLVDNTIAYNALLPENVKGWSNSESPVIHVDVNANYNCRPASCPDGYDGLHPNSLGEYHIAEAFAREIKASFGFDGPDFEVPSNPEPRNISTPTNVRTASYPEGLRTDWDYIKAARGYDIRSRIKGQEAWWSEGPVNPVSAASWSTWVGNDQTWEFQVRTRGDNDDTSDWSDITSATTDVKTSAGPTNIAVTPTSDGLQVTWDAVVGYDVNRYGVIIWDRDLVGSYIEERGTTDTSMLISGLVPGHTYSVWVSTWINLNGGVAGGLPGIGADVVVGGGAAAQAEDVGTTDVDVTKDEDLATLFNLLAVQGIVEYSTPVSNSVADI